MKIFLKLPSQAILKSAIAYDPETGIFTRRPRSDAKYRRFADKEAGWINNNGYRVIKINQKQYLAHRLAWVYMTGEPPRDEIDHADCNRLNNVWTNLRQATSADNMHNRNKPSNNTSGTTGVVWSKKSQKWVASIKVRGYTHHLGYYDTQAEAATVRRHAATNLFGDYAHHTMAILSSDVLPKRTTHRLGKTGVRGITVRSNGRYQVTISRKCAGTYNTLEAAKKCHPTSSSASDRRH